MSCLFCRIASGEVDSVMLYEDEHVAAFLDVAPIRPGHALVIPRAHFDTFDEVPVDLMARVVTLSQQLARRMKAVYGVDRVGLVFTGGDIAHAHAHVLPIHEKGDITSRRYVVGDATRLEFGAEHLRVDGATLARTKAELNFRSGG